MALECWAVTKRCIQDWCPRSVMFAKAVRNQMVPSRAEWRGETDNWATTPVGYCPSTASFPVRPHCTDDKRNRCQAKKIITASRSENWRRPPGHHRTTWRKTIQQDLKSNNLFLDYCDSEASTLETDGCVWHYAPLAMHATQEDSMRIEIQWLVL